MASFKSHPVFASLLLILGLVAAGEGYLIYNRYAAFRDAVASLDNTHAALDDIAKADPVPSEANQKLVADDFKAATTALEAMRRQLTGKGDELIAGMPDDPTKVSFAIDLMIENMAKRFKSVVLDPEHPELRVKLKDDERFGFTAYYKTGPAKPLIPDVFRQLKVSEYLLGLLADAKPEEFVALKRERARSKTDRAERQTAVEEALKNGETVPDDDISDDEDLFAIDPYGTSRVGGFVDAYAIKISFNGVTSTLQNFLNSIAESEYPLVTKAVETEIVIPDDQADNDDTKAADKAKVPKPITKFTVTVEYLELVPDKTGTVTTSVDPKSNP